MVAEDLIINSIGTVGFPIVGFYLMYQLCKDTIQKNTDALNELKEAFLSLKK